MIIKPPKSLATIPPKTIKVFLAGTIEMGESIDWQSEIADELSYFNDNLTILNPRRDNWDPSWKNEPENPAFFQQVTWELDGLDKSDIIFVYLEPKSKSPVTLLEIGLYATSGKLVIVCPPDFWRRGNIEMVAIKHDIPLFNNLDEGLNFLKKTIENKK